MLINQPQKNKTFFSGLFVAQEKSYIHACTPLPPTSPHPSPSSQVPSDPQPHQSSRRNKPTRNLHPLRNTTALFPLHIHNIRITPAPAPDTVLFLAIPLRPVIVVFFQEFQVLSITSGALLLEIGPQVGFAWELARRSVGGTVLDCRVAVAEVAEVVDVGGREEGSGCEGVDWGVAPLGWWLVCVLSDK
jgi:hypothetical protein